VPGVYDPAMPVDPDSPVVEVGMEVRVLLRSGEDQRGEVVQLGEQSLVLGRVGNYGFQETETLYVDIVKIEVESAPQWAAVGLGVVGVTLVLT
jgi:hypothetical protein